MQSEAQAKYVLQQILYETKWSGDFLADSPPLLIEMLMYKELCVIYFIKVKRRPLKIKGAAYTVLKFESAEDMLCCFDKLYNHHYPSFLIHPVLTVAFLILGLIH